MKMTSKNKDARKQLLRLAAALVEDIMETPDEEILAEVAEDCGSVYAYIAHAKRLVGQSMTRSVEIDSYGWTGVKTDA